MYSKVSTSFGRGQEPVQMPDAGPVRDGQAGGSHQDDGLAVYVSPDAQRRLPAGWPPLWGHSAQQGRHSAVSTVFDGAGERRPSDTKGSLPVTERAPDDASLRSGTPPSPVSTSSTSSTSGAVGEEGSRGSRGSIDAEDDCVIEQLSGAWVAVGDEMPTDRKSSGPAPATPVSYLSLNFKTLAGGADLGGKSGSRCVTIGGERHQLKKMPVLSEGVLVAVKQAAKGLAKGGNTEICGELVAAAAASAFLSGADRALVPVVRLVHDDTQCRFGLLSRHFEGRSQTLDAVFAAAAVKAGQLAQGRELPGHVKLVFRDGLAVMTHPQVKGEHALNAEQSRQLVRHLVHAARLGDHDINPGNFMLLEDGAVARIDFGHAVNDLVAGSTHWGGGIRHASRILDFFNRDKLLNSSPGGGDTKLWRDYQGLVPSALLAQVLAQEAQAALQDGEAIRAALAPIKLQMADLVMRLSERGPTDAAARAELGEFMKSMGALAMRLGVDAEIAKQPLSLIDEVFKHLCTFLDVGAEMAHAARLCALQVAIDQYLAPPPDKRDAELRFQIEQRHDRLRRESRGQPWADPGPRTTWMKSNKATPAAVASLGDFIKDREAFLRSTAAREGKSKG